MQFYITRELNQEINVNTEDIAADDTSEFSSAQASVRKTTPCTAGAPTAMCRPKPPPIGSNETFYGHPVSLRFFLIAHDNQREYQKRKLVCTVWSLYYVIMSDKHHTDPSLRDLCTVKGEWKKTD